MEVYRYELFAHTAQASVTVGECSDDAAQVEVFVNAPILKGSSCGGAATRRRGFAAR